MNAVSKRAHFRAIAQEQQEIQSYMQRIIHMEGDGVGQRGRHRPIVGDMFVCMYVVMYMYVCMYVYIYVCI